MSFLRDISVKARFTIGIGIFFCSTLATLALAVYGNLSTRQTSEELQNNAAIAARVNEIEIRHLVWAKELARFVIDSSSTTLNIETDPTKCSFGQWYNSEQRTQAEQLSPVIRENIQDILPLHDQLHHSAVEIQAARVRQDENGVQTIYKEKTIPALNAIQKGLTAINSTVSAHNNASMNGFVETLNTITTATVVLSAIATGFVVVIAFLFFLTILRPLAAIAEYAKHCMENNAPTLAFTSKDELGALASTLRNMVTDTKRQLAFSKGILSGLVVPSTVYSPQDTVVFTNKPMMDLIERDGTPEDVVGMKSGLYVWGDASKETLSTRALREHKMFIDSREITTLKGNNRHINVFTAPFFDESGELLGTIATWLDVTALYEKQQSEEQIERIAQAALTAQDVSHAVIQASQDIASQVDMSSHGADIQRDRIAETATAMSEMNATVFEVARSATNAATTTANAKEKALSGAHAVATVVETINNSNRQAQELQTGMASLGEQAEGISKIMSVINDIADQTNLLALNAAIEAARAGEAGRGFAVVADEVRKLAEKTMEATREVGTVISGIQRGTHQNIEYAASASASIGEAVELATRSGESLQEIVNLVEQAADQVHSIAAASEEQSAASDEINKALEEVNRISTETSEAMNKAKDAVHTLHDQAQILQQQISLLH